MPTCAGLTGIIGRQLVRLSSLSGEADLVGDFGIYGNRVLGVQEIDDHGRTIRFTLSFDFTDVLAAEQRWERLTLYATAYRDMLGEEAKGTGPDFQFQRPSWPDG